MGNSLQADALQEVHPPVPLTGTRIWTRRFATLWCVGFLYYASVYLLVPVLPLYLQQRGASTAVIGTLLGSMSMAALFFRPFAGWLSDAFGHRPLIILGLAGLLIFNMALPFIAGFALFGLLRIISGIGWGSLTANANTLAGEISPPGRRGEAIGYYTMAGSYGGLITFLPLLAKQRSLGDPGLFFTIYAGALIVLRGTAGKLYDRFGRPAIIAPGLLCGGGVHDHAGCGLGSLADAGGGPLLLVRDGFRAAAIAGVGARSGRRAARDGDGDDGRSPGHGRRARRRGARLRWHAGRVRGALWSGGGPIAGGADGGGDLLAASLRYPQTLEPAAATS